MSPRRFTSLLPKLVHAFAVRVVASPHRARAGARRAAWVSLAGAGFAVAVSVSGAHALIRRGVEESFVTRQYEDLTATTCAWDTTRGVIELAYPRVAGASTVDAALDVDVAGDVACVADSSGGLLVFDVTNPFSPVLRGAATLEGAALGVTLDGTYAYAAVGPAGVAVVDVSDPSAPLMTGAVRTLDVAWDLVHSGGYLYVADGTAGLVVVDVTNPAAPARTGSLPTGGSATGIAISGDRAFVASGAGGLWVVDVSSPTAPVMLGKYSTFASASDVFVDGDRAFVASGSGGLEIVDVSDPTAPFGLERVDTPGFAHGVAAFGSVVFVADGASGLQGIDVTTPAAPFRRAAAPLAAPARAVTARGEFAYVADDAAGLEVVRIADPVAAPDTLAIAGGGWWRRGVDVAGDYAYSAHGYGGLEVFDVSNPAAALSVGTYPGPGFPHEAWDVVVADDRAFVAWGDRGLVIVDVTDPTAPALVDTLDVGTALAKSVALYGRYALVGRGSDGLQVIDVESSPPVLVASPPVSSLMSDIAVEGHFAFVAAWYSGLRAVDLSNPASPAVVASWPVPGGAAGVATAGAYVFVTESGGGQALHVLRFDGASTLTPVGSVGLPHRNPGAVAVEGDHVLVACDTALVVVDVTDPASPVVVAEHEHGYADNGGLAVAGRYAFYGAYTDFFAIDVYADALESRNRAQSVAIDGRAERIGRVRFTSAQTGDVAWEASVDGGATWTPVAPDGTWQMPAGAPAGTDLAWRATLTPGFGGPPSVDSLAVEWLVETPVVEAVTDIPGDQGGQVRLRWTRSAHDFVGDSLQVVEYAVYRRIDAGASPPRGDAGPRAGRRAHGAAAPERPAPSGAAAREHARRMLQAGWDYVATVPVRAEDAYSVVVPTLADSSIAGGQHWSVFRVSALTATPGVFFDSPPDSGYSVDNLAPSVPANLTVAYNAPGGNAVAWDSVTTPDLRYYVVYRSTDPAFVPSAATRVHATTTTGWTDPAGGIGAYYKVTAVDFAGNESAPATAQTVTGVEPVPVRRNALHEPVPNPFNPSTTIAYDVARDGASVTLVVYDVAGRRVRTLVSARRPAGRHVARWNGRDDAGRPVASGVYFARLETPGFARTRKMVLVK